MKYPMICILAALGAASQTQAQTSSTPESKPPAARQAERPEAAGEACFDLEAGPLCQVVNRMEDILPAVKEQAGSPEWFMPNIVFGEDTENQMVPGNLRLRRVSPVQALTLVGVAAGCAFEPILAPSENGGEQVIVGYQFVRMVKTNPAARTTTAGTSSGAGAGQAGMLGADPPTVKQFGPNTLIKGSPGLPERPVDAVPASNEDAEEQLTCVYALGRLATGMDEDWKARETELQQLVAEALQTAGVGGEKAPLLAFHFKSRALIVRATSKEHEIISQALDALRSAEDGGPAVKR